MKQFGALFYKDFMAHLSGFNAYIIFSIYYIFSFISALYFGDYFTRETDVASAYFSTQPTILLFIIPVITMRTWAEEMKNGTIELLLTQPISITKLVLSKFFAAYLFFILLTLSTLPFLFITNKLSILDIGVVLSCYLGLFLTGLLFIAIGCLFSACFRSIIISYITTIFALFILIQFQFSSLKTASFILPFETLNFDNNYISLMEGVFTIGNIIYFILATILLLWLNVIIISFYRNTSIKKRKFILFSVLLYLIFMMSIVGINSISNTIIDVTDRKLYTLTEENKEFLQLTDKRIDITLYEAKSGREMINSSYASYAHYIEQILNQIEKYSLGSIRYSVVYVEPFSTLERQLLKENIPYEEDQYGQKIFMALALSDDKGNIAKINSFTGLRQNLLETDIMRLIRSFGTEKKKVAVIASHDDLDNMTAFRRLLQEFYIAEYPAVSDALSSIYDAVIIINPYNIPLEMLMAMDQYVLNGGSLLIFTEPTLINNSDNPFIKFMKNFGIQLLPESSIALTYNDVVSPFGSATIYDSELWKDIRSVFVNDAGTIKEWSYANSNYKISPILLLNNNIIASSSQGFFTSNYPEAQTVIPSFLQSSKKEGKVFFFYDSDLLNDHVFLPEDEAYSDFYQLLPKSDNILFLLRLLDNVTENQIEQNLAYPHYPMNQFSIGGFLLKQIKEKYQITTDELQNRIEKLKQQYSQLETAVSSSSTKSMRHLGDINSIMKNIDDATDELHHTQALILNDFRIITLFFTFSIIFVTPIILLLILLVVAHFFKKYKNMKIRSIIDNAETN